MKKTVLLSLMLTFTLTAFESSASSFDITNIEIFDSKQNIQSNELVLVDSINFNANSQNFSFSAVILAGPITIRAVKASTFTRFYNVKTSDLSFISARNRGSPTLS